jgi:hypothetical protein
MCLSKSVNNPFTQSYGLFYATPLRGFTVTNEMDFPQQLSGCSASLSHNPQHYHSPSDLCHRLIIGIPKEIGLGCTLRLRSRPHWRSPCFSYPAYRLSSWTGTLASLSLTMISFALPFIGDFGIVGW